MSQPNRAIYLDDGPLPDHPVSRQVCELRMDLTDLPEAMREPLAKAMVAAADDFIHSLGIYPMPHLECSLAGTEVPCPRRFHINQQPANSGSSFAVSRPPIRAPVASLRVINPNDVLTIYVDNVLGDDSRGDGTLTNPLRTRAAVEAMASTRSGVIVMRRPGGELLGTLGDLPPDPPRPASPVRLVSTSQRSTPSGQISVDSARRRP